MNRRGFMARSIALVVGSQIPITETKLELVPEAFPKPETLRLSAEAWKAIALWVNGEAGKPKLEIVNGIIEVEDD